MGAGHQITCKQISVAEIQSSALVHFGQTLQHSNIKTAFLCDAASGSTEVFSLPVSGSRSRSLPPRSIQQLL